MLKLYKLIHTCTLTCSNINIKRGLLLLPNMIPVNPLRLSHNKISEEYHTVIEVKLKHSAKPMIIRATLRLTPRVNPPLLSGSLSYTLCLVVHSSNIVGYLSVMYLKHTKVNTVSWLSSLM